MSQLLSITDFDGAEFIDRIHGLWNHMGVLASRAESLEKQTEQRIEAMRRNAFIGSAEIGEAFLHVQEKRPGEFWDWFRAHEEGLGFSERQASRCLSAAKLVREHGETTAFALSQAAARAAAGVPILALSVRLMQPIEGLSIEKREELRARLLPAVELYRRLSPSESSEPLAIIGEPHVADHARAVG